MMTCRRSLVGHWSSSLASFDVHSPENESSIERGRTDDLTLKCENILRHMS